jgi:pimeloyl-ACP methyl ester carboxylesterase
MSKIKEKNILVRNAKVHYKVAGEGPAILILHGWGSSSESWLNVQGLLAKAGLKVFLPDLPGFGQTTVPQEPWSITDYMKWINEFTEAVDLNNFSLFGHSFGGRVAIKFSVTFPNKLESLILCDSAGLKTELSFKRALLKRFENVSKILPIEVRNKASDMFLANTDYVKAKGVMKRTMENVIGEDLSPYLSEIRSKTLIIWGQTDKMVPVKYAHVFHEGIKNSVLQIIPETGHSPHLQAPDKLVNTLLEFFNDRL